MNSLDRVLVVHEVSYFSKPVFEFQEIPEIFLDLGLQVGVYDIASRTADSVGVSWGSQVRSRLDRGEIHYYPSFFGEGLFGRAFALVFSIIEAIRVLLHFRPQLVFSYSVATNGLGITVACRLLGIPVLHRAIDASSELRPLPLLAPLIRILEVLVASSSDLVVLHNPALEKRLMNLKFANPKLIRTRLLLPPLLPGYYLRSRGAIGQESGTTRVLFIGTFFRFSGLPDLVESLHRGGYDSLEITLVGDGEGLQELKLLVESLGLSEAVHFEGFVPFESLAHYLAKADVCVNPMVPCIATNVALPNKVIQYLLSGKLVVSTRLAGLESILGDIGTLRLVDRPNEVLRAALELKRAKISEAEVNNAVSLVAQRFSPENFIARLQEIIEKEFDLTINLWRADK